MSCRHCAFGCTSSGIDMPLDTFKEAAAMAEEFDCGINIGGGEPTLHPDFWEILGISLGSLVEYVWLSTNGSITDIAIPLARMAAKGIVGCQLSRTQFHDDIDIAVEEAFHKNEKIPHTVDRRGYVGPIAESRIARKGRGINFVKGQSDQCVCEDTFVEPTGVIRQCGCENSPVIGDVFSGIFEGYTNDPCCGILGVTHETLPRVCQNH